LFDGTTIVITTAVVINSVIMPINDNDWYNTYYIYNKDVYKYFITFDVPRSTDYPSDNYDLVAFFDCFHDMGDPSRAARHVLQTLRKKDGICMLVEPFANDKLEDNLKPLGRVFYSVSSIVGVPASLSENGTSFRGTGR
jgi:hypothetical protein